MAYDLKIDYTPGRLNVVADMLSHPPIENIDVNLVQVDLPQQTASDLRTEQLNDPDLRKIVESFENPDTNSVDYKSWSELGYFTMQGILYRYTPDLDIGEAQLVAPKSRIQNILSDYHDAPLAGHYGAERTYQRIASRYYWTGSVKQ
ncbi:uncharacterized protein [Diabrotica undecimpunctata]|uniref:uncharacterized protein n=1 Tax=Diabrotica undecimpunctata TaxID=50387 RepID=UPI003B6388BC